MVSLTGKVLHVNVDDLRPEVYTGRHWEREWAARDLGGGLSCNHDDCLRTLNILKC